MHHTFNPNRDKILNIHMVYVMFAPLYMQKKKIELKTLHNISLPFMMLGELHTIGKKYILLASAEALITFPEKCT